MELLNNFELLVLFIAIMIMGYHLLRKFAEIRDKADYYEQHQYNIIYAIMGFCILIVLINLAQYDWIFASVWLFNTWLWKYNLTTTQEHYNQKRKDYQRQQSIKRSHKARPDTNKEKTISEELDDMLKQMRDE